MSVPGVGSDAADQISSRIDEKALEKAEEDEELDDARDDKEINDHEEPNDEGEEADKLESGEFLPHAMPHINWQETDDPNKASNPPSSRSNSIPDRTRMNSQANGNGTSKPQLLRPYGRGGAARRPSVTEPSITSEAAELARAEAASWAQMTPLMAATLGPMSVLLGIPSLTQRWHGYLLIPPVLANGASNFVELPDPPLNLALAGVSVLCEVIGNALLILRFSNFHTKITTWASYAFWIAKVILGIANYVQFGIAHPETDNIIYLQGFWVGVCSMAITVIIIIFLTFNLAFLHRQSEEVTRRLHYVQREFMMQTLVFFFYIGITGLIFCKVEGYTYTDGIYYMVVTTLTIGFGDITPATPCMKVLTFPFTIIGITLLALIVTSIVRLLADRARRRKLDLKKRLKKKVSEKKKIHAGYGSKLTPWAKKMPKGGDGPRLKRSLTLQEELERLREDDWKRERRSNLKSMALGFAVFLIFWFIGALIFDFVEPWGYGNALYFCYIFFLTIGFGDFYPTTEAGKPIFIVYALLAVPTMTIIVETVTTNFTAFTMQRVHRRRHRVYQDKDFEIQSLTELVKQAKVKTCERVESDISEAHPVELPLHHATERIVEGLQQMHHHLQTLLMQKLGPDARNVIAAERARQDRQEKERLEKALSAGKDGRKNSADHIASHLSEVGQDGKDELELLNEYRERYANVLAELYCAKERLIEYEKDMQDRIKNPRLQRRLSQDIEELSGDDEEVRRKAKRNQKTRRRSSATSGGALSSDDDQSPVTPKIGFRMFES